MSMDREERQSEINLVTEKIITCVYGVSNTLGSGFLEKVYENAWQSNCGRTASKWSSNIRSGFSTKTNQSESSLLTFWSTTA